MKIALHSPDAQTIADLQAILSDLGHDAVIVPEIVQAVETGVAAIFAEWALTSRTEDLFGALAACATRNPPLPIVVLLASRSQGFADRARAAGAADVLFLPPDREEIEAEIDAVAIRPGIGDIQSEDFLQLRHTSLVGDHPRFLKCLEELWLASQSDDTVLLLGETGVGKEMFAKAIHELSPRSSHEYRGVNCANLSEQLLEAELFGTEPGAFSGAVRRTGKLEEAGKGTFLLDEIGDLPADSQSKLLRVLEERHFQRLGSNKDYTFQARLICATSVDLNAAVEQGKFRRDLLGRIDLHRIALPPLRERASDIPLLAQRFLDKHAGHAMQLGESTKHLLNAYPFPMNVRQLESFVRYAIAHAGARRIVLPRDLPEEVQNYRPMPSRPEPAGVPLSIPANLGYDAARAAALRAVDAVYLPRILEQHAGNRTAAAKTLGIDRKTFGERLKSATGQGVHDAGGEADDEAS